MNKKLIKSIALVAAMAIGSHANAIDLDRGYINVYKSSWDGVAALCSMVNCIEVKPQGSGYLVTFLP